MAIKATFCASLKDDKDFYGNRQHAAVQFFKGAFKFCTNLKFLFLNGVVFSAQDNFDVMKSKDLF